MSFQIIGIRIDYDYGYGGYTGNRTDVHKIVATFDKENDAHQYIEDSKLKNPTNRKRPFRHKSLLANFERAVVEKEIFCDSPPHNPRIKNGENG